MHEQEEADGEEEEEEKSLESGASGNKPTSRLLASSDHRLLFDSSGPVAHRAASTPFSML
ncbi:pspC domain protein [Anopheles sinensis]|uniref:PspC domain protein n=1 Tax=Anopheles sinensis TaxID=74873 RepID=A0A084VGW3_ANOSI|nr:pspC domain protein [Anopheles sinensis]